MEHEDRMFPAIEYEGEFVAEAFMHNHDELPHLHQNLNELFPRAVAKEEEAEGEDTTPCGFEERGEVLGKTATTKPTTVATTTTTTTTTTADHRAGGKGDATAKKKVRFAEREE